MKILIIFSLILLVFLVDSSSIVKRESITNLCENSPCLNGGECVQPDPNLFIFYCKCSQGFTGVFCEIQSDPTAKIKTTTTTSAVNSQLKACPSEYTVCQNNGNCLFTDAGSILCNCPLPYTGAFCEKQNKFCDLNPCKNGAPCKQTGEFDGECDCKQTDGFSGTTCNTKTCDSSNNPCKNEALCLQIDEKIQCLCVGQFMGEYCDIPK